VIAGAAWLASPAAAWADGFLTHDLATVAPAVQRALGPGYNLRVAADRIDAICTDCADSPILGVQLGRQADGTEQRVRSGATSLAALERLCRAREPRCRLAMLDVAPAVGWVSAYPIGDAAGATAIVMNGGDMLTIRAITRSGPASRKLIDLLLPIVRVRLVGR
jgi:hypothetical protein